jgi:hypothetical protein
VPLWRHALQHSLQSHTAVGFGGLLRICAARPSPASSQQLSSDTLLGRGRRGCRCGHDESGKLSRGSWWAPDFLKHHLVPVVMLSSCNSCHCTDTVARRHPSQPGRRCPPAAGRRAAVASSHALDASHAYGEGNVCTVAMNSLRDGRQLGTLSNRVVSHHLTAVNVLQCIPCNTTECIDVCPAQPLRSRRMRSSGRRS